MVKPEKARAIEDLIIRMAQTGQIRAKLEENQLIELLAQLEPEAKPAKVVVSITYKGYISRIFHFISFFLFIVSKKKG